MSKHKSLTLHVATWLVLPAIIITAHGQVASNATENKLPVRLVATLDNYKGPSRFVGRKAMIIFSPSGDLVAMSGTKGTITIWETKTGTLKATLSGGKDGIDGFAFAPDGRTAATRDYVDKDVRLWEVETWKERALLTGRKRNLETKLKANRTFEEEFGMVPFSHDGSRILSEREDDLVTVWDVASGKEQATLNHDTRDSGAKEVFKVMFTGGTRHFLWLQTDFSNDGRWIFTVNGDKSAKIWDTSTGQLKANITNSERIYRAGFSPDSSVLITVEQQGGMKLWDVETGKLKAQIASKGFLENLMKSFEFSPDGKYVATYFLGDTRIWNATNGEPRFKLTGSGNGDASFSPGGRWIATAGGGSGVAAKIWNAETGELTHQLLSNAGKGVGISFSPDGHLLVTTNDKGVSIWDPGTGEHLANLVDARYPVTFSPDSRFLVTGARRNTALLWEIPRTEGPIALRK
jgi:WD40 repeat protein